jgi:hypothetical protein
MTSHVPCACCGAPSDVRIVAETADGRRVPLCGECVKKVAP